MSGESSIAQSIALGAYFLSGCLAINVSQALATPLYLINEDWYNAWISFTKQSFSLLTITLTQWWAPTTVRVSGDASMRGQLFKRADGNLVCNFPARLIMIANHQIYTDWLYLWWVAHCADAAGRIYIILKESLKNIPVIGWGIQLSQFILLKRDWEKDKPHLSKHLQKLKTRDPMWLLLFPEGTNLAPSTRQLSQKWAAKNGIPDMQHTLHPRTTGLQFCLQELRDTVDYVYDCTIAYEGVPRGQYAQDIYTLQAQYLQGKPPAKIHMYWRRFRISDIPTNNVKSFESWLRARWIEKDAYIEHYYRTEQMPCDRGISVMSNGTKRKGCGYIETPIKATAWHEFLRVFMPIGALSLVLHSLYNQLPQNVLESINNISKTPTTPSENIPEKKTNLATKTLKMHEGGPGILFNNKISNEQAVELMQQLRKQTSARDSSKTNTTTPANRLLESSINSSKNSKTFSRPTIPGSTPSKQQVSKISKTSNSTTTSIPSLGKMQTSEHSTVPASPASTAGSKKITKLPSKSTTPVKPLPVGKASAAQPRTMGMKQTASQASSSMVSKSSLPTPKARTVPKLSSNPRPEKPALAVEKASKKPITNKTVPATAVLGAKH